MRSFQFLFWVIFILFYAIITFGALKSILQILKTKRKRTFRISYLSVSIIIFTILFVLYIWPGDVRSSDKYAIYFLFNGILFIDVFSKIPLSFFFLIGLFLPHAEKRKIINWMGIILTIPLCFVLMYGMIFGKNKLNVKHIDLEYQNLPSSFHQSQIVLISDIHLGSFIKSDRLLNKVEKEMEQIDPDFILFTGDLVNNYSREIDGWENIFQKVTKGRRSFSILGNHDYGNYHDWENDGDKADNFKAIVDAHKNFGFQLLNNKNTTIISEKDSIYIIGVENWGHPPFPQYANLKQASSGVPENSFQILLTHDPAHWEAQIENKKEIELTLSGHTHGLQWAVLPAGIPFSLSYFVRKNWGGLYKSNNSYLYVNTGLGTIGTPWRIDIPAEMTVITLKRVEID